MSDNNTGKFIISLDYEQYWGIRDSKNIRNYEENLAGVWRAIPKMLALFEENNIHATWATVGFLFATDIDELMYFVPQAKPSYENIELSPYPDLMNLPNNSYEKQFYFGKELIEKIKNTPYQEIASHTFCHYYCLEDGQTKEHFKADLKAALEITSSNNIGTRINTLIFPRNQVNLDYLDVGKELGFTTYRGNETTWVYKAKKHCEQTLFIRIIRLLDSYVNLTGHHTYRETKLQTNPLINIPSSRFLRPYNKKLRIFEHLRLHRIKQSLTYAAKNNEVYHLWWHPHNFGKNVEENIKFLGSIIDHFKKLQKQYGMKSVNMGELAEKILMHHKETN